ncbi:hypothetical protein AB0I94_02190 [Streptomyces sp. NPDC050147]|uniref:hypothetical protein n=1 Tax=Streptomyces sp. NPDC050147 TaxID=3155513 RepID=UPI0034304B84
MTHRVNTRDYPADRIERYVTALNDADTYAQLERRDDRVRFARAVMAVADAETDPVYKSGYDTGVMHAHAGRIAAERDCLALAVQFAIQWRPDAPMGLREGIEEILATLPLGGEKSSREAIATPQLTGRLAQLLDAIRTWPGQWTTTRVMAVYRAQGLQELNRSTARGDLQALTERGHLVVCGPENARYYLLARKDGRS